jgi:hypothetical protein
MTDHDRGAYTPQPDAPLQFDARGPRGRKPMPMTLIGSVAVFVVLLGALALHYRNDSKRGGEAVRPVGEPVAQIKTAVPASAPPKDAATGVDVFNGASQPAKAPTFAPAPEEAKPRQQLTVQAYEPNGPKTQVATAAAPAPTVVAAAKPARTVVATAKPAPTPAYHAPPATTAQPAPARPDATSVVARLAATPAAKPAAAPIALRPAYTVATAKTPVAATKPAATKPAAIPTKTAATATPAKAVPAPTTAASGSVVQIGAFSSAALSDKGWSDVSAAMTGEMGGKAKRVEPVEVNGHTLYRTSVTGFASRAAAEAFCKALVAKGHTCFAKG